MLFISILLCIAYVKFSFATVACIDLGKPSHFDIFKEIIKKKEELNINNLETSFQYIENEEVNNSQSEEKGSEEEMQLNQDDICSSHEERDSENLQYPNFSYVYFETVAVENPDGSCDIDLIDDKTAINERILEENGMNYIFELPTNVAKDFYSYITVKNPYALFFHTCPHVNDDFLINDFVLKEDDMAFLFEILETYHRSNSTSI